MKVFPFFISLRNGGGRMKPSEYMCQAASEAVPQAHGCFRRLDGSTCALGYIGVKTGALFDLTDSFENTLVKADPDLAILSRRLNGRTRQIFGVGKGVGNVFNAFIYMNDTLRLSFGEICERLKEVHY
jgi:hypothetical protein